MQNGDKASPSNIFFRSSSFRENAHNPGPNGIFCSNYILMYFNIVQQLVCKTVTRLHRASFWSVELLVKILITLEPHGIFGSIVYTIIFLTGNHQDFSRK